MLSIDDLHWVDRPSLRFLAYLVRRLEEMPVLVGATLRTHEPGADQALIAEIANDPLTALIRPGALGAESVAELIASRLGQRPDDGFASACHAATGGNPLLLHELLRALAAEGVEPTVANAGVVRDLGPRAASRAVLLRLARLPPEAAKVARAVAVLGDGAELWAVADLAGLDERAAAEATGDAGPGRDPALRATARLRPPAGPRRRLPRAAARRARARAPARGRACCTRPARRPSRSPRTCCTRRAVRSRGSPRCWRRPAAPAPAPGAAESAVAYLRRALDEPLGARSPRADPRPSSAMPRCTCGARMPPSISARPTRRSRIPCSAPRSPSPSRGR